MKPSVPKYKEETKFKSYTSTELLNKHTPHLIKNKQSNELVLRNSLQMETEPIKQYSLASPHMQLSGHQGEVYCVKFSPSGDYLVTAGFDKRIFLWDIYNNCQNIGILGQHKNAVLDMNWTSDGSRLFTASADKTIQMWDMETYLPLKKFKGHTSYVNACDTTKRGSELLVSGGDEGNTKLWDIRIRKQYHQFEGKFPITAVSFNESGEKLFTGGLDNIIRCYDLRKLELEYTLNNHSDTITGLSVSNDGTYLISNGADMKIIAYDIRTFVSGNNRMVRVFTGATHNQSEKNLIRCSFKADGQYICTGSADKYVYIWDFNTRKLIHRLGGHTSTVNEAVFSPKNNLIASASGDKTVIIGEIPEVTL